MRHIIFTTLVLLTCICMGNTTSSFDGSWGSGAYLDVHQDGGYAWCAAGAGGLDVLKVGDVGQPVKVGSLGINGYVQAIYAQDALLILAGGQSGLWFVSVENPTRPKVIGHLDTPGEASALDGTGDILYVADGTSGLATVDISQPSKPQLLGHTNVSGVALDVRVNDQMAVVAAGVGGLHCLSLANPFAPKARGWFRAAEDIRAVCLEGDIAMVAGGGQGLLILDVGNLASPVLLASVPTDGIATNIANDGFQVYVTGSQGGMQVVDASLPTSPRTVSLYSELGEARAVSLAGGYAYVAGGHEGLKVIDLYDPDAEQGSFDHSGNIVDADIAGDLAVIADRSSQQIALINLAYIKRPIRERSWSVNGDPYAVATDGELFVTALADGGIMVADLHAQGDMGQPAYLDLGGEPQAVALVGDRAYVASGSAGFYIIDLKWPHFPRILYHQSLEATTKDLVVEGDRMLVVNHLHGLMLYDISQSTPILLTTANQASFPTQLAISGDRVFVADLTVGVWCFRLSGDVLSLDGLLDTDSAYDVAVGGDQLHVTAGTEGLKSYDLTNYGLPTLATSRDTQGYAGAVAADGNALVVADGFSGKLLTATNQEQSLDLFADQR